MNIYTNTFLLYLTILATNSMKIYKRISMGIEVFPKEIAYQASITVEGYHFCGAVVISKTHLLTAAHCVQKLITINGMIAVLVGSVHLNIGFSYTIKRMSLHKGFWQSSLYDDIAVLHLTVPLTISEYVLPIALPTPYFEVSVKTPVIISGFGSNFALGPQSPRLLKISLLTAPLEECQETFPDILRETQMCTIGGPGFGCCSGDSGGPMVDASKSTILGIVSISSYNCGAGDPDVYTKVSYYISYIQEEMNYDENKQQPLSQHPAINFNYPFTI